ncbi:MAG: argininosuccinate lyase [Candidatus Latescibacterota bacterium]
MTQDRGSQAPAKSWSGRFAAPTDALMEAFNASIGFDRRLAQVDVTGSRAWARALERAGVLTGEETRQILDGLEQVRAEMAAGRFAFTADLEDIHMAVEKRLTELVGRVGGKLHTGRSRNDQVCLDERLYLRQACATLQERIGQLQEVLVASAEERGTVLLPGYTHLQQAQPILFAHYALSLFWMLERDRGRLADAWERADVLPLGAGALAGTTFPVDRRFLARELGFRRVSPNSLDAVSDRDFLVEFVSAAALLMMHLSRYCEDLVIWSSAEFGFVELADAFATGSSMMPQKKNPDSLELVRGKTGRVYGDLVSLLTTMKGIPLTYAKDMQEDKEPFFDALETAQVCLQVFTGAWATLRLHPERMEGAVGEAALATDLADYLARRGMPFRQAHHVVAGLVRQLVEAGRTLGSVSLEELQRHCPLFAADVTALFQVRHSLELRNVEGGTGPQAVAAQLEQARRLLAQRVVDR